MSRNRLILASASPQRKTLLAGLGLTFDVLKSDFHEPSHPEWDPRKRALELSHLKAQDIYQKHKDAWVIGCDTLVVAPDGSLLEKPNDAEDAKRMLRLQSGGTSLVHSGLTLIHPTGKTMSDVSTSLVTFKHLTEADIEWWIGTNQWKDRSGSFQIDGLGQLLIERLDGDWTSVVGLPVYLLGDLMEKAEAPFLR